MALQALQKADPSHPNKHPVPYTGIQFVAIPEFQAIGTTVGQAYRRRESITLPSHWRANGRTRVSPIRPAFRSG
ncbi:hypothetical protein MESS2_440060 [Mesorhizobium metallidurans STM 2683]|uniref:Uncharacterized protein n=1 Tax=Mesorhizobium metallidurans STM 2683 TaxID=1297569 RepID=M5ESF6_9HYPH|nr:hypothetical protein MESS2_440060 [Mesorhizobium metallidurans STM 2683]